MITRVLLSFGLVTMSCFLNGQSLNYYFGNLHSHSGYSDGNQDSASTGKTKPSDNYIYAKASMHFDFLGISEHNHYSGNHSPGMRRQNYAYGLAQAAAANVPGTFLTLYGMEWGVSTGTGYGHVVVYGFNQLIGWETSVPGVTGNNYDIYNAKADYDGLFRKVKNNPGAFCYVAHPSNSDYNNLASSYNSAYDSAIVGAPLRSGLALVPDDTYNTYPSGDYVSYYKLLLRNGYHVGATYDHDNHYLNFGRNNAGRLVILAPALTVPDLYTSMKSMHFYGSDDWNAKIDFRIGTSIMGDTTSGTINPTFTLVHNDGDGEATDSMVIWSGKSGSGILCKVVASVKASNTLMFTDSSAPSDTARYYFAEIIQADGDRIMTSPIWYTKRVYAGVQELDKSLSFILFPNPATSKLNLSTTLSSDYTVEIWDVSGKKIISEVFNTPDVSISTKDLTKGFY
ncbi:MAG: T9SS type A sorting domain-containing protein, partial [Bacteroidia bacterium]